MPKNDPDITEEEEEEAVSVTHLAVDRGGGLIH